MLKTAIKQAAGAGLEDDDLNNRRLLRQIADERDALAMERLYLRFRARLAAFLRRMTADEGLIEEVYHDVMLVVWNKAHQYQGQSKVSSWIFSIAYRKCLRLLRKQQFRSGVLEKFWSPSESVTESVSGHYENVEVLDQALNALAPKQRIAIELAYYAGHSMEEIGAIMSCPTNTVKTRLHAARRKLKDFVEDASQPVSEA